MGTSSSKVPRYEVVDNHQQASTSDNPRASAGNFSPPSQGLLQPSSSDQQWAPVQQASPPPLPHCWDFHIDPATGYPYFYNTHTEVSQWQDPRGPGFALPSQADSTHLGQRRQVIPPWEGGPADVDPLSWSLPPGWQEQQDQATSQRYFVNYDAHILSYKDPRLEIAKAYTQGPTVEGLPVNYPPPVISRPVDEQPKPFEYACLGSSPLVWSSAQGGTSYLPPPPPLKKKKKKHSLWSKLGYRHGRLGGGLYPGGSAVYLFDNPEVSGVDDTSSSSNSSSDNDQDDRNGQDDMYVMADAEDFSLGHNLNANEFFYSFDMAGDGEGIAGDMKAINDYGQSPCLLFGGGNGGTGVSIGNEGGGKDVSGGYQQSVLGPWQTQAKDFCFQGRNDRLKSSKNIRFLMFDGYLKMAIVLTVLVGAYFGLVEGLLSFLVAVSGRLVVLICKRGNTRKGQQKRSSKRVCDTIRLVVKKQGSSLLHLKTSVLLQWTQIQAWFYEYVYEHPLAKVRMLTEKDEAGPLYSRLLSQPRQISIVTQASADRLPAIEAMAKSWGGVMCVAIHVRTRTELQQVYPRLCCLHEQIEAQGLCQLHICMAKEEGLLTDKEAMAALYPINAMRNIALSMATTDLVFILDADFVPSLGMHDLLTGDETTYANILRMAKEEHQMLVVPAFEAWARKGEDHDVLLNNYPTRMFELREQWMEGSATAFHCSHFPRGHRPTNYECFFNPSTSKPYRVQYREFYEPYTICAREVIPPFDARFRGYGLNKISHAFHCAANGMAFSVLPDVFVWSLPHCKSQAWTYTFGRGKDPLQYLRILGLYRSFKSEVQLLHKSKTTFNGNSCQGLQEVKVEEPSGHLILVN